MADHAATGLRPAYLPKDDVDRDAGDDVAPKTESFCWRSEETHVREGGFALIAGDPGTGKSVTLRILAERLSRIGDVTVGAIAHPQLWRVSWTMAASSVAPLCSKTPRAGIRSLQSATLPCRAVP